MCEAILRGFDCWHQMLYLFIVEMVNVFIECGIMYEPLITVQYGSAPIQLFAAWRINVITKSYILPSIIGLLSLASFGSGIDMCVKVFLTREFRQFGAFQTTATIWLALTAVCDLVTALGMAYALYTRKTGFSIVDGQIKRIIRLTLETGTLTAAAALADIILFLAFPMTTTNFIVDFPLSALYTCLVLAMMNSRQARKARDLEQAHSGQQILSNPQELSTFKARSLGTSSNQGHPTEREVKFEAAEIYTSPTWPSGRPLSTPPIRRTCSTQTVYMSLRDH
ncbi:hypothetical protein C8R45DRAFT_931431 [Mycena sanguinolenta]|nr:hypothetical protein C8R45DRAFT_931431 [Mycena sanguinolenta]